MSYNLICRSKTGFSLSRFDLGKSLGLIRSTSKSPARNRRPAGKRCVEISLRKIFYTTKVVRVGLSTLKIVNSQSGLFVPDSYKTQTSHRKMRHVRSMYLRTAHWQSFSRYRQWVTLKNCTAVYSVPYGNEGCMVDTLASRSDERRDMAAISFGKVPNNL